MNNQTDYAERLSERYSTLRHVGQEAATMAEAYVPMYVRRGPRYVVREMERAQKKLEDERRRAREDQIRAALNERSFLDILLNAPVGPLDSVFEVIGRSRRVVLLAPAGAGKTTALQYLATHPLSGTDQDRLALIVDLAAFVPSGQSLPEYLSADAKEQMSLELTPEFFGNLLASGQAVVCLDGLDEISGQQARALAVEQIEKLVREFPIARYVVTARADAYEPTLQMDEFEHYLLLPWNEAIVDDMDRAWREALAGWTPDEIEAQKAQAPRLMQDILAARDMAALIEGQDVNAVWSAIRPHLWDASWQERIALVYRFFSQERPKEWDRLMTRLLDAGLNDPYKLALHRYALVAASALAASVLSDDLNPGVRHRVVDGLVEWMTDASMAGRQEAVNALFRLENEPYVVQRLLPVLSDKQIDVWSREAAALLTRQVAPEDASGVVESLWPLIDDGEENLYVRQAAAASLGYLGSRSGLSEELQQAIREGLIARARNDQISIDVRAALTEALGQILLVQRQDDLLAEVVSLARGQGETKIPYAVQFAAGRALAAFVQANPSPEHVAAMWELARDETVDEIVRVNLAVGLGRIENAGEAAQLLLAVAQNPKIYPPAHKEALDALGRLGYSDESVTQALVTITETKDRKVKDFERLAAAHALAEIGELGLGLQYLLTLIADKSIYRATRNEALSMLGQFGFSGDEDLDNAVIAVLQVWATEENTTEDVREQTFESIVQLGINRPEIVRDLVGVTQDKRDYPRVRRAAVDALARLPLDQEMRDMVVEALQAPFFDTEEKGDLLRVGIARLLYLWGGNEQALEYLQLAAEQSYMAMVRYRASLVLHELGVDEVANAELLRLATNNAIADPIRAGSLRALSFWNVGDEGLAQEIKPILWEEDPVPSVRAAAYQALKSLLTA